MLLDHRVGQIEKANAKLIAGRRCLVGLSTISFHRSESSFVMAM